jgi:hypothetical protein
MSTVVASDLRDKVGALLDVDIGSDTTPDEDQVNAWLYDGAIKMMSILPLEMLGGFMKTQSTADIDGDVSIDAADMLRIVSVTKGGQPCVEVPLANLHGLALRAPYLFRNTYAYARMGESGEATLQFYPADSGQVEVYYIAFPDAASSWSGTSSLAPPESWSGQLVEYAALQGKIQDEEPQQAQMLYQMWVQSVQVLAVGKLVSGEGT